MANITVCFQPSTLPEQSGSIRYRVAHERMVRHLSTDYRILPEEWDERRRQVTAQKDSPRVALILTIRDQIRADIERLSRIGRTLDLRELHYTTDDIIDEYQRYRREYSLFGFMANIITHLKMKNKIRTSETYTSALSSFRKFRKGADIMLDCITHDIIEDYEAWLIGRGLIPNSVSFYMRILRAAYRRAVNSEILDDKMPFRNVYTGVDRTVKRALPLDILRRINNLDLSSSQPLDYARDMFMMSFYLRGMSFIDMAFLRKSNLRNGIVTYRRRKTGQRLAIAWESEMQNILNKYPENATDYLLPIITNPTTNERSTYRNKGYIINRNLKKIAAMLGVDTPLTLYVARHSWASIAHAKGIPISVISEGMGHDSEATTQIYLASLDTSAVDRANSIILKSLK